MSVSSAGHPGARMVLACGFGMRGRWAGMDASAGQLRSILARLQEGRINSEQAARERHQCDPPLTSSRNPRRTLPSPSPMSPSCRERQAELPVQISTSIWRFSIDQGWAGFRLAKQSIGRIRGSAYRRTLRPYWALICEIGRPLPLRACVMVCKSLNS